MSNDKKFDFMLTCDFGNCYTWATNENIRETKCGVLQSGILLQP